MKVAYYSPMPPSHSGIADYSALLLPALERRIEVAVVRRPGRRTPRGTDLALYHAKHTGRNRVVTWAEAHAEKTKKAS